MGFPSIWLSGFGEENFKISSICFHYFAIISPLLKGVTLHLNELKLPFNQQSG